MNERPEFPGGRLHFNLADLLWIFVLGSPQDGKPAGRRPPTKTRQEITTLSASRVKYGVPASFVGPGFSPAESMDLELAEKYRMPSF